MIEVMEVMEMMKVNTDVESSLQNPKSKFESLKIDRGMNADS